MIVENSVERVENFQACPEYKAFSTSEIVENSVETVESAEPALARLLPMPPNSGKGRSVLLKDSEECGELSQKG